MDDHDAPDDHPAHRVKPEVAAADKLEELRMYAELAAVFEGTSKFQHELRRDLTPDLATRLQKGMLTLERARPASSQLIPADKLPLARELLAAHTHAGLTPNDYHLHIRPGQVLLARRIAGADFDTFHDRLEAHFGSMIAGHIEDEESARRWKGDPTLDPYLKALETGKPNLTERYLVPFVKSGAVAACLSTHTADELNIAFLAETIMGLTVADLVGRSNASGPSETPDACDDLDACDDSDASDDLGVDDAPWADEADLAWYFKLFLLRGTVESIPAACFFGFLQKTGSDW